MFSLILTFLIFRIKTKNLLVFTDFLLPIIPCFLTSSLNLLSCPVRRICLQIHYPIRPFSNLDVSRLDEQSGALCEELTKAYQGRILSLKSPPSDVTETLGPISKSSQSSSDFHSRKQFLKRDGNLPIYNLIFTFFENNNNRKCNIKNFV